MSAVRTSLDEVGSADQRRSGLGVLIARVEGSGEALSVLALSVIALPMRVIGIARKSWLTVCHSAVQGVRFPVYSWQGSFRRGHFSDCCLTTLRHTHRCGRSSGGFLVLQGSLSTEGSDV